MRDRLFGVVFLASTFFLFGADANSPCDQFFTTKSISSSPELLDQNKSLPKRKTSQLSVTDIDRMADLIFAFRSKPKPPGIEQRVVEEFISNPGQNFSVEDLKLIYFTPEILKGWDLKRNLQQDFTKIFGIEFSENQITESLNDIPGNTPLIIQYSLWPITQSSLPRFPKIVFGGIKIDINRIEVDTFVSPRYVGGSFRIESGYLAARRIVLPKYVGGNIHIPKIEGLEEIVFPEQWGGDFFIDSLSSDVKIVRPNGLSQGRIFGDFSSLKFKSLDTEETIKSNKFSEEDLKLIRDNFRTINFYDYLIAKTEETDLFPVTDYFTFGYFKDLALFRQHKKVLNMEGWGKIFKSVDGGVLTLHDVVERDKKILFFLPKELTKEDKGFTASELREILNNPDKFKGRVVFVVGYDSVLENFKEYSYYLSRIKSSASSVVKFIQSLLDFVHGRPARNYSDEEVKSYQDFELPTKDDILGPSPSLPAQAL